MLQAVTDEVTISSNINVGEDNSRLMGIHQEALAAITDSMVNLYTDKKLAVIREYSTNARDAIVAAGKTDPVRVSLPNELEKMLVISDNGIGMSRDEVLNFYSQYGASDKRDTNVAVGTFGFGCKAAFTISGQFFVTAVKDGWKTEALFSRDERGVGTARVLSHTATDDENGVTVKIPSRADLREVADRFFYTWPKGTVLVDGLEPECYLDHGERIEADGVTAVAVSPAGWNSGIFVVMGGVAYPAGNIEPESGYRFPIRYNTALFLEASIGDVDIVPSREGLRDTERTVQFVREGMQTIIDDVKARARAKVDAATTLREAVLAVGEVRELELATGIEVGNCNWQGRYVPAHLSLPARALRLQSGRLEGENYASFSISDLPRTLFVVGDSPKTRNGVSEVLSEAGYNRAIFVPEGFECQWLAVDGPDKLPGIITLTAEEFSEKRRAAARAARGPAPSRKSEVSYHVISADSACSSDVANLPTNLAFASGTWAEDMRNVQRWLERDSGQPDLAVVALRKGQSEAALQRRAPHAVPFMQLVEKRAEELLTDPSPELLIALRYRDMDYWTRKSLDMLKERREEITSPDLREEIRMAAEVKQVDLTLPTRCSSAYTTAVASAGEQINRRFPLLQAITGDWDANSVEMDHAIKYINAVTTCEEEE